MEQMKNIIEPEIKLIKTLQYRRPSSVKENDTMNIRNPYTMNTALKIAINYSQNSF